jgi:hypothetical protein
MEDEKWRAIGQWNLLYLTTGLEGMALYILKNVLGVSVYSLPLTSSRERLIVVDTACSGSTPRSRS